MEKIVINGGRSLEGRVKVDGMKNAAVAVIFASIVTRGVCIIDNLPDINDVRISLEILKSLGASVKKTGDTSVEIDTSSVENRCAPRELVGSMRASYYLVGAMLSRFGETCVCLPGGCDFGNRPIDQHLKAFRALGADAAIEGEYIKTRANPRLRGAEIYFDNVTVGGTINAILAAMGADDVVVINNAAKEPHVVDLANFLNTCGASIRGAGTSTIKIKPSTLHGCEYSIIPDMLEAGAYMVAAAATKGSVYVDGIIPKHIEAISMKLIEMGAEIREFDDGVMVSSSLRLKSTKVKTMPYPGFPTDMQPLIAVLMCTAEGVSEIKETIYENRFRYVEELKRMGARVSLRGNVAEISGVGALRGASVRACDLRAGAAMVIAALAAEGKSEIDDIYHIERGYANIIEKLKNLGADIRKITYTQV